MKNLVENIEFSSEKADVSIIKKSEDLKYFAVALGKGGVLKKFDLYEIPVNVEYEVIGLTEENLFSIAQEL